MSGSIEHFLKQFGIRRCSSPAVSRFFALDSGTFVAGGTILGMAGVDSDLVQYALRTARAHGFRRLRHVQGEGSFEATLGDIAVDEGQAADPAIEELDESKPERQVVHVTSPAVGYFRLPDNSIEVGARIERGIKIGEVIAVGMANDVMAEVEGEITEMLVADGDAVEFGQPLITVR